MSVRISLTYPDDSWKTFRRASNGASVVDRCLYSGQAAGGARRTPESGRVHSIGDPPLARNVLREGGT